MFSSIYRYYTRRGPSSACIDGKKHGAMEKRLPFRTACMTGHARTRSVKKPRGPTRQFSENTRCRECVKAETEIEIKNFEDGEKSNMRYKTKSN